MSIASEITRINNNIADAYTAANGKGATLPATQNSANLATCIGTISGGGGTTLITKTITQNGTYNASSDNADGYSSVTVNVSGGGGSGWQPEPDWWDIETILTNDTENYAGKAIILYSNSDNFTNFTISSPIEAVATSDGAFYTSSATHTWDRTKDKIVSSDASDTAPKYGTRYLILYFNTASPDYSALTNFRNGSIYAVFKCNIALPSNGVSSNTFLYNNRTLQSFKFLTGYNFSSSSSSFKYFCRDCYSLVKLPDNLDTSSATSLQQFCAGCYSLVKLPDNLDTSSVISFTKFCYNCYSLIELPDVVECNRSLTLSSLYSLVKANIKLPTPSSYYTLRLQQSTIVSIQSLQYIADNAPTVSGITAKVTIGSTNIARAGGASGTIITTLTSKGWTVN